MAGSFLYVDQIETKEEYLTMSMSKFSKTIFAMLMVLLMTPSLAIAHSDGRLHKAHKKSDAQPVI